MFHGEQGDPYNYPSLNKKDTMFLSTINNIKDGCKTTVKEFCSNRTCSNNLYTKDIEGSSCKLWGSKVVNKPEYSNISHDIDGAAPRPLHFPLSKPEFYLTNQDIGGTQPNIVKFQTKRLPTDPLQPKYKLPYVEIKPPTPLKFIRDNINIDDIHGAKPRKAAVFEGRDYINIEDIEGSRARKQKESRKDYNYMDYNDVSRAEFKSKRSTNPLDPRYDLRDEEKKLIKYGKVEGDCPKPLLDRVHGPKSSILQTKDIDGAQSGTKGGLFCLKNKYENKFNYMNTKDIEGAQASTLQKFKKTGRSTNPLEPKYQLLGNSEIPDINSPYGKTKSGLIYKLNPVIQNSQEKLVRAKGSVQNLFNSKSSLANAATEALKTNTAYFYGIPKTEMQKPGINRLIEKPKDVKEDSQKSSKFAGGLPNKTVELDLSKNESKLQEKVDKESEKTKEIIKKESNLVKEKQESLKINSSQMIPEKKEENKSLMIEAQKDTTSTKENPLIKPEKLEPTIANTKFHINEKKFYGEKSISSASSKGSIFQENINHFFTGKKAQNEHQTMEIPKANIDEDFTKPKSLLQKMKQPHFSNDPKYGINEEKFYNSENKFEKPKMTYAEKLNKFVANI